MRAFVLAFGVALCLMQPSQAATYDLPINGPFDVIGDFKSRGLIFGHLDLYASIDLGPLTTDSTQIQQYMVTASISGDGFAFGPYAIANGTNARDSHPYDSYANARGLVQISASDNVAHLLSIVSGGASSPTGSRSLSEFNSVALRLTLPDGFYVAAVPEPTTWALMLLGFAGLSFVARRRSIERSYA